MSHFLDRLQFFKKKTGEFADGHGEVTNESRQWEDGYRQRWQHDKIVRSTHGVNCTGSCSWKIYVKNGLVTWETQQTDYPRTRPDLPNHEPRGCPRGASYSWYLYSANRLKYPKVRKPLLKLWRDQRRVHQNPVDAWAAIVEDPAKADSYKSARGMGGFIRSSWNEVNEIIAAANVYTAKQYGPDRIVGFSPIPAMSMISYAAGSRYLSLIGGVSMSFYDWYCDLPPASPMTWGEQTDVPESADWYNSNYIICWGSNVPQTRTPDAHFLTEVRYKGAKTVAVTPDYAEVAKLTDLWLNPKQGTDAALAMAFGHVILKEFHLERPSEYFTQYVRENSDMPMLVMLESYGEGYRPTRFLRASDLADNLSQDNNPEWKTIAYDEHSGELVSPLGSIGYRWGEQGKWNIEAREGAGNREVRLQLSLIDGPEQVSSVAFPYFGHERSDHWQHSDGEAVQFRNVPSRDIALADGSQAKVATVYDLNMANYAIDRGLGGGNVASGYDDASVPNTPAWQQKITGVDPARVIQVAREFADTADKTRGKSMIIVGAGMNHWYHMDMNYRGLINMLIMCGCVGQSGGGWAHYVGQAASAVRLAAVGLRPGLEPPAAADELHLVLLQPQLSVAPRESEHPRCAVAAGGQVAVPGAHAGLQHQGRAHGLAAQRAAAQPQSPGDHPPGQSRGHGPEGLRGAAAHLRRAALCLRIAGRPGQLPAQHVHLALQRPGLLGQGPRIHAQVPAGHQKRRDERRQRPAQRYFAHRGGLGGTGRAGQAGPDHHAGFSHVLHLSVFRHRAADRELV